MLEFFPKQQEVIKAVSSDALYVLSRGGSGSGKTVVNCYVVLYRALSASGSHHAIFRKTKNEAREHLFDVAFKQMMDAKYPNLWEELSDPKTKGSINHTEMRIELDNGSVIYFHGLDDADKRKGANYSTIYIDEADSISDYGAVETLATRLREKCVKDRGNGKVLMPKMLFATNPNVTDKHWLYRAFIDKVNPTDNIAFEDPDEWLEVFISTLDNPHLPETYIKILMSRSALYKRVYLHGEWLPNDEDSMFQASWINEHRHPKRAIGDRDDLIRVLVAIDPATTSHAGSDETGIMVVGLDENAQLYVLEDCSGKYKPNEWAKVALDARKRWGAENIIAERNAGGELIGENLLVRDPFAPFKLTWASKSKEARAAESVVHLYERGQVHHCGPFEQLEKQMLTFTHDKAKNKKNGSPDRLDALVWAIKELAITEEEKRGGGVVALTGFWR